MSAVWSYVLASIGIAGLLIAAHRPRVGWSVNIAVQALWVTYAIVTRQWGFIFSALAYTVAYVRLLRAAPRWFDAKPKATTGGREEVPRG